MASKKAKKPRDLFLAVQPGYDPQIYAGKPRMTKTDCDSCGQEHSEYGSSRGSRLLTELCDDVLTVLKVKNGPAALYKLTVTVEPVE